MSAEIVCRRKRERYCWPARNRLDESSEMDLTIAEATALVRGGAPLLLRVDGWREPWPCGVDADGALRARCPTASEFVRPRVVYEPEAPCPHPAPSGLCGCAPGCGCHRQKTDESGRDEGCP